MFEYVSRNAKQRLKLDDNTMNLPWLFLTEEILYSMYVYKTIYNTCNIYKACKTIKKLSSSKKMRYQTQLYSYMKEI